MAPIAPQRIANPVPYSPRAFGLLSAAALVDVAGNTAAGATWQPDACGPLSASLQPCADPDLYDVDDEAFAEMVWQSGGGSVAPVEDCLWTRAAPFTLHASLAGDPTPASDTATRAERLLTNREPSAVERMLALGGGVGLVAPGSTSPRFSGPGTVDATPTAGTPTVAGALAILERTAREDYDGQVIIHATPEVVTLWAAAHLLYVSGTQLRTYAGSIVVSGAGYPGASPTGTTDPTVSWAYATGMVAIVRSAIYAETDPSAQRTRSTNAVRADRARDYLLALDECAGIIGVPVSLLAPC